MKLPIIVLSYGEFAETKKLFIYENNGIPIMPIFYDAELALKFGRYMERKLREFGDQRRLLTQVCDKPRMACDMLQVISTISPELHTLAIDPTIEDGNVVETDTLGFDEAIEQLQEGLSDKDGSDTSSDESKTR